MTFTKQRQAFETLFGDDVNFIATLDSNFGMLFPDEPPLTIPFPSGKAKMVVTVFPNQRINWEDRKQIDSYKPAVLQIEADGMFGKCGPDDFGSAEWMVKRAEAVVLWACGPGTNVRNILAKLLAFGKPMTLICCDCEHQAEWHWFILKHRQPRSLYHLMACTHSEIAGGVN